MKSQRTSLKRRMREGELTIGSWLNFAHPQTTEMMAKAGFDWIVVDMEHSSTDYQQMMAAIQIIDLCGVTALVRVGSNEPLLIKKALDAGASGIIVPMVNTVDDALAAVSALYYPPKGKRGIGLYRAHDYGSDFERYYRESLEDSILVVQIEHFEAVKNLKAILAIDDVDGFIVGPYDISGSLGYPGDFNHPDMQKLLDRIDNIAIEASKPGGYHIVQCDSGLLSKRIEQGYRFLAYSTDMVMFEEKLRLEKVQLDRFRSTAT